MMRSFSWVMYILAVGSTWNKGLPGMRHRKGRGVSTIVDLEGQWGNMNRGWFRGLEDHILLTLTLRGLTLRLAAVTLALVAQFVRSIDTGLGRILFPLVDQSAHSTMRVRITVPTPVGSIPAPHMDF